MKSYFEVNIPARSDSRGRFGFIIRKTEILEASSPDQSPIGEKFVSEIGMVTIFPEFAQIIVSSWNVKIETGKLRVNLWRVSRTGRRGWERRRTLG